MFFLNTYRKTLIFGEIVKINLLSAVHDVSFFYFFCVYEGMQSHSYIYIPRTPSGSVYLLFGVIALRLGSVRLTVAVVYTHIWGDPPQPRGD